MTGRILALTLALACAATPAASAQDNGTGDTPVQIEPSTTTGSTTAPPPAQDGTPAPGTGDTPVGTTPSGSATTPAAPAPQNQEDAVEVAGERDGAAPASGSRDPAATTTDGEQQDVAAARASGANGAAPTRLANTGAEVWLIGLLGVACLAGGAALMRATRPA